jgi:hypothetical protein
VTTWSPGDGGHEVLSYGRERPPRRPPPLLVGGLVGLAAGAVLGFVAGTGVSTSDEAVASDEGERVPPVAAGAVTRALGPAGSVESDDFQVSLFNSADENVAATVVALPGWAPRLTDAEPTTIAPRSWGVVGFSAPPDCRTYPATVRVVHVRIRSAEGVAQRIVPLAEPADDLQEHHEAVCADYGDGVSRWRW